MKRRKITYTAAEYSKTKGSSGFRDCVEKYTILSLIGNPRGLRILDAGCGDGLYARLLADLGASHITGVDCADDFVELARRKSEDYGVRIEYHLAFIQDFFGNSDCDLVLGSFILNYARSLEEAVKYCMAIASHLKPGGRFVGFNNNPFEVFSGERYAQYGFRKAMSGSGEGREVIYKVDGMTDPIVNYYLNPQTHEQAFLESGLKLEWKRVLLHPSEKENPHWNTFFEGEPPFIAMLGRKMGDGN